MEVIFTHSFRKIKAAWGKLYKETPEVSPFLNPEAFAIAYRYFYPYYIANLHLPMFCVFSDAEEVVAIIPLLKGRDSVYRLFGAYNGFNECGFVYRESADLKQILTTLKDKLGKVEFQKIDERCPVVQYLPDERRESNNVAIYFENGYEDWFKSLSSSARQNLRTSYNRVHKDGKNLVINNFVGVKIYLLTKSFHCIACGMKNVMDFRPLV